MGTCTPCSCRRRGSLGSLQLQVRLRDETVLPSHCYQPLVQLLCQEVKSGRQVRGPGWGCGCPRPSPRLGVRLPRATTSSPLQDGRVHLVTLLDETTTAECRQEVAVNLVKLFLGQGLVKEFLDLLFELELAKPCKAGVGSSAGRSQPSLGAAKSLEPCVVILRGTAEVQLSCCAVGGNLLGSSRGTCWPMLAVVGGGTDGLRLGNPCDCSENGQGVEGRAPGNTPMAAASWGVSQGCPHRPSPLSQVSPTLCFGATPWPQNRWSPSSRCHTVPKPTGSFSPNPAHARSPRGSSGGAVSSPGARS